MFLKEDVNQNLDCQGDMGYNIQTLSGNYLQLFAQHFVMGLINEMCLLLINGII